MARGEKVFVFYRVPSYGGHNFVVLGFYRTKYYG